MAELQNLETEAEAIESMVISEATKQGYYGQILRFLNWMRIYFPDTLKQDAIRLNQRGDDLDREYYIALFEKPRQETCPVKFENITYKILSTYFTSRKSPGGITVQESAVKSARSAIKHLYRMYDETVPVSIIEGKLKKFFAGLKHTTQKQKATAGSKVSEGKSAMSFQLYQTLCKSLMRSGKREDLFAVSYLTMSWNLMCRASNTSNLHFNHLEVIGDAVGVYFAVQKNDQSGMNCNICMYARLCNTFELYV